MPKLSEIIQSKYLKKEDIDDDTIVTVRGIREENVGREDDRPEMKWILFFREFQKGMVLNPTNAQLVAKALGSDDSDDWIGKRLVMYVDDSVSFGGKIVGGLRVKAYRKPRQDDDPPRRRADPEDEPRRRVAHDDDPPPRRRDRVPGEDDDRDDRRRAEPARGGVEDMDDDIPY